MSDESHPSDDYISFLLQTPESSTNPSSILDQGFESTLFTELNIMSATVTEGAIAEIEGQLIEFCEDGGELNIFIGLGLGPDPAAIRRLRAIQDDFPDSVSLNLVKTQGSVPLFHPKIYWFHGPNADLAIVGSSNWTNPGLQSNIEATSVFRDFDTGGTTPRVIQKLETAFEELRPANIGSADWIELYPPSEEILSELESSVDSPTVAESASEEDSVDLSDVSSRDESLWPLSGDSPELIMDVLKESRRTQLVPTKNIWERFFNVNSDEFTVNDPDLPSLELSNVRTGEEGEIRRIVVHDHQGTVEIPELRRRSSPGNQNDFIVFRKLGDREYEYEVFFESDDGMSGTIGEIEDFMDEHGFKAGNVRRAFISIE